MLVAIDPGLRHSGLSVWDGETLVRAGLVRCPGTARGPSAWNEMADRLFEDAKKATYLILELPQVYQRGISRGDPNDLIQLAALVGTIQARFRVATTVYLPREWKGQVPKEIIEARAKGNLSASELSKVEVPAKSLAHNVWDAVGLGLVYLTRLPSGGRAARARVARSRTQASRPSTSGP